VELNDLGRQYSGSLCVQEIKTQAAKIPYYQAQLLSSGNVRANIYRFALWLCRLLNRIDQEEPDLLYILPDIFVEVPMEIFRAFKLGGCPLFDAKGSDPAALLAPHFPHADEKNPSTLAKELVKLVARHFTDPRIPNPDLKDLYLRRLNYLMQFQEYLNLLEECDYSRANLVPMLFKALDKRYLQLVCKNFLRFAKCRGFKELSLKGQVPQIEDTYSDFFLGRIREILLVTAGESEMEKIGRDFMNVFFN
jgi:hypothetical protein